jgi:DNA-binding CsgD family transcriptional regulator
VRRLVPSNARTSARATGQQSPALGAPRNLEAFELDDGVVLLTWSTRSTAPLASLTEAEAAVLDLVRAGLSNAEIAARRGRSYRTIANQLASIYTKLGVASRFELLARLSAT